MTLDQLRQIMPNAKLRAAIFIDPLNAAIDEFRINTPARQAAFLAQVGHESGQLLYVRELASGAAYEGREDLGNTQPGDGVKYRGRGLIQLTGRANYVALMMALNIDCIEHPEVVEQPVNACRSAGWFWQEHDLNSLADAGDFLGITKKINGGTNGFADRQALYAVAKQVLGAT
jgi:putative chitinase